MSKDLEKEYSEMIRSDMPDLWDRIRTSLPEKEIKTKVKTFPRRRYMGIAAACVCAAILIPVIALNQRASRENAGMSSAAATEMKTAEAVTYNAAAAAVEDAAEEKTMEFDSSASAAAEPVYDAEPYEESEAWYEEDAAAGVEMYSEAMAPAAASAPAEALETEAKAVNTDRKAAEAASPETAEEAAEEAAPFAGVFLPEVDLTILDISDGEEFVIRASVSEELQELPAASEILLIADEETPEDLPEFREGDHYRFDLEQYPEDSPDTYRIRAVKP